MDIRESLSRLKKRVKHLGSKRKPDRSGADTDGEIVDPANPLPRPEYHGAAGDGGWDGVHVGRLQARSTDRPPQPDEPELVTAGESENGQGGGEAGANGREVSRGDSHPYQHVRVVVGSGPSREGDDANGEGVGCIYSCSSATRSVSRSGKPDGMWAQFPQLLSLIIPSDNTGTPTIPDCTPGVFCSYEGVEPSATMDENKPNRRPTVSATAKLLCGVRDSTNASIPLKSVAGVLCFVLENCEVWPPSSTHSAHNAYDHSSKQK